MPRKALKALRMDNFSLYPISHMQLITFVFPNGMLLIRALGLGFVDVSFCNGLRVDGLVANSLRQEATPVGNSTRGGGGLMIGGAIRSATCPAGDWAARSSEGESFPAAGEADERQIA